MSCISDVPDAIDGTNGAAAMYGRMASMVCVMALLACTPSALASPVDALLSAETDILCAEDAQLSTVVEQARRKAETQDRQTSLREQLLAQLNKVLAAHDSAHGIIVTVSDLLFDAGQSTLKIFAQVKLARVAGILNAFPGIQIELSGYTETIGKEEATDPFRLTRAETVRDFLVSKHVVVNTICASGDSDVLPVRANVALCISPNQQMVELVVSGALIGRTSRTPDDTYRTDTAFGPRCGSSLRMLAIH